jgi:hypothetical protein
MTRFKQILLFIFLLKEKKIIRRIIISPCVSLFLTLAIA